MRVPGLSRLADMFLALKLGAARDLTTTNRAARKYNRSVVKFTKTSYQLFEHPEKTSYGDFCAPCSAQESYPIREAWILP